MRIGRRLEKTGGASLQMVKQVWDGDSGLALWGGSQGIQAMPKLPIRRVSCSEEQTCLRVLAMLSDGLGAALEKYGPSRGVVVRAEQLGLSVN